MKQIMKGPLTPGNNKVLIGINVVLFFGALVLAVLNVNVKEYISAVVMLFVMILTGANIYGCWKRLKK